MHFLQRCDLCHPDSPLPVPEYAIGRSLPAEVVARQTIFFQE